MMDTDRAEMSNDTGPEMMPEVMPEVMNDEMNADAGNRGGAMGARSGSGRDMTGRQADRRETMDRQAGNAGERMDSATDTRNASMGSEPSEEEIRIRAYRRYLERGGSDGMDFDDWVEAERELKSSR